MLVLVPSEVVQGIWRDHHRQELVIVRWALVCLGLVAFCLVHSQDRVGAHGEDDDPAVGALFAVKVGFELVVGAADPEHHPLGHIFECDLRY